jgi:pSer/pThr/pTyr-binding forkhead associated (FHA) protein
MADYSQESAARGAHNSPRAAVRLRQPEDATVAPTLQSGRRAEGGFSVSLRSTELALTRKVLAAAARARQSPGRQGCSMKLSLVVLTQGKMKGQAIPIPRLPFLIGRARNCQLRPTSPLISKMHCGLAVEGAKVFLNDFKSMNGTFLNDKKVEEKAEVHDRDVLRIGSLEFMVRVQGLPAPNEPTPLPPHRKRGGKGPADEEIAALLLSGDGEALSPASQSAETGETSAVSMTTADTQVVPPLPPDAPPDLSSMEGDPALTAEKKAPEKDKSESEKPKYANTSEAAESILKMYMRRKRG